jgi:hypothetical protein
MEFELVRPNFAHFQGASACTSEDSWVLGREGCIDLYQDGYLRPESPAVSVSSGGHSLDMWPRPPTTTPPGPPRPTADFESSMEAHRNQSDSGSSCAIVECDERYDLAANVVSYLYIPDFNLHPFCARTLDPFFRSSYILLHYKYTSRGFAVLGRYIYIWCGYA